MSNEQCTLCADAAMDILAFLKLVTEAYTHAVDTHLLLYSVLKTAWRSGLCTGYF